LLLLLLLKLLLLLLLLLPTLTVQEARFARATGLGEPQAMKVYALLTTDAVTVIQSVVLSFPSLVFRCMWCHD